MKIAAYVVNVLVALMLLVTLNLMQPPPSPAAVYTIAPHADVYVDSQNPTTNYEGSIDVFVTYFPDYLGAPLRQRTFLKFDLSVIPAGHVITAAKLYLFVVSNGGHPSPVANLYHVGDDWSKFSLTWNTQPPTDYFLASRGDMFWGNYYAWDLFASRLWKPAQDLADKRLSLMLKLAAEGEYTDFNGYTFSASEAPANHPYLQVTAVPPPVPSVKMLLLP